MLHVPLDATMILPSRIVPSYNLTVLPASAAPEALMVLPEASLAETRLGAEGANVSTVTFNAADAALRLPMASAASPVKRWLPSDSVPVANDQAPVTSAIAVPIWIA